MPPPLAPDRIPASEIESTGASCIGTFVRELAQVSANPGSPSPEKRAIRNLAGEAPETDHRHSVPEGLLNVGENRPQ